MLGLTTILVIFAGTLFLNDGYLFGLALILLVMVAFVSFLEVLAVSAAQRGKRVLPVIVIILWSFTIFATFTSGDPQWQSKLIFFIIAAMASAKIYILIV